MNQDDKERLYQEHVEHDDDRGFNIEGCFYCGGDHPSDCCTSSDKDEYWSN